MLAKLGDCKQLSYLKKHVWETTYRGIYSDERIDSYDYEQRENKFKNTIKSDDEELYVCKENEIVIGYMVIGKPNKATLENYDLCINDLGIHNDYRGQGIGTEFLNIAKSKQKKLFNCCNYYNLNAKKFYEKNGGKIAKIDFCEDNKGNCQIYFVY